MSVKERMKFVIAAETADRSRYVQLKDVTGISGDVWKNFWFDRREPDAYMLETLSQAWPKYAFWLATGITDPERGHIAPSNWESHYPIARGLEQTNATAEFKYLIERARQFSRDDLASRKREVEDAIFDLREKMTVPAVFVSYEKVMRELGESGKPEYFLIETDKELRAIRASRLEDQQRIQKRICDWRKNLETSQSIDKIVTKILSLFVRAPK